MEWDGYGLEPEPEFFYYFTYGHADMQLGPHRSELAKVLKTDGVVDSFSEGLNLLDSSSTIHGLAYVEYPGERPTFLGEYGDYDGGLEEPATWVMFEWE